jgi:hypothetical protein
LKIEKFDMKTNFYKQKNPLLMCRNVRSIEWQQKTYQKISWDYPFNLFMIKRKTLFSITKKGNNYITNRQILYYKKCFSFIRCRISLKIAFQYWQILSLLAWYQKVR